MSPSKSAISLVLLLSLGFPVALLAQSGRVKPKRREKITTINSSWEKTGVPGPTVGKTTSAREEPWLSDPPRPRRGPTAKEPGSPTVPVIVIGGRG
jgi:hypothetical protein